MHVQTYITGVLFLSLLITQTGPFDFGGASNDGTGMFKYIGTLFCCKIANNSIAKIFAIEKSKGKNAFGAIQNSPRLQPRTIVILHDTLMPVAPHISFSVA